MEEQVILTIQKLIESGALKNLDQPGAQSFVIYALLIVLAMLSFRVFVVNGWLKKGLERFFSLEEKKLVALTDLNIKVIDLQHLVLKEHEKLHDVLQMMHARRESDEKHASGEFPQIFF